MKEIINFFINPETYSFYRTIRLIFLGVSFYLFLWIVFLLLKNSYLKHRYYEDYTEAFTYKPFGRGETSKRWDKVAKRLSSEKEPDLKMALIEADSILGDTLRKMGYEGETITDILRNIDSSAISNLEDVRKAHEIRNKIVHDPDYKLNREKSEEALKIYEDALRGLEAL